MLDFFLALLGTGFYSAKAIGKKVDDAAYKQKKEEDGIARNKVEIPWIHSVTDYDLEKQYNSMMDNPSDRPELWEKIRPVAEGIVDSTPEKELFANLGPTPSYYHSRREYLMKVLCASRESVLRIMLAFHGKVPEQDARMGVFKRLSFDDYPTNPGISGSESPHNAAILRWTEQELRRHGVQCTLCSAGKKYEGRYPTLYWRII